MANLNYNALIHSLSVTCMLVAATYWSRKQEEFTLINMKTNYQLANMPGKEANTVIPDGWLLFQHRSEKKGSLLVEIDRGTEYRERFKQHISTRLVFIESGKYEEIFEEKAVQVVYIVVGEKRYRETRKRTMIQWTQEVLQKMELENWGEIVQIYRCGV